MIVACPYGFKLKGLGALNAHCPKCRRWRGDDIEAQQVDIVSGTKPPCVHRGERAGVLECQCGTLYQCNLLGVWCSYRKPLDQFVRGVIGDDHIELTEANYRPCEGCGELQPPA